MKLRYVLALADIVPDDYIWSPDGVNIFVYYVNKRIAPCKRFKEWDVEFENEEDFFKFKLTWDIDDFAKHASAIKKEMREEAMGRISEQAKNLNW